MSGIADIPSPLSGPDIEMDGLEYGAGFLLWFDSGYPVQLEGFTYGEDTSQIDFSTVGHGPLEMRAVRVQRD